MRGSFASLRMTAKTCRGNGKGMGEGYNGEVLSGLRTASFDFALRPSLRMTTV